MSSISEFDRIRAIVDELDDRALALPMENGMIDSDAIVAEFGDVEAINAYLDERIAQVMKALLDTRPVTSGDIATLLYSFWTEGYIVARQTPGTEN